MLLLQADLLGTVKENKFDELARIDLHQAWEQQADAAMLRQLVHGVQHGFKRSRNQGDDDDDVSVGNSFMTEMYAD
jgi:hypothetical protein